MSDRPFRAGGKRLGPAFDLLAAYQPGGFFFERAGTGVSGTGVTQLVRSEGGPDRIERLARAANAALAGIRLDTAGVTPVVVGAIPFDERRPAELFVPARVMSRTRTGETWQVDVWPDGLAPADVDRSRWTGRAVPHEPFSEIQLRSDPEPVDYREAVVEATRRIEAGEFRKVVLARTIVVDAGRALDPKQLLWRLRAVDPDCYTFAAPELGLPDIADTAGVLVGATPELLVAKSRNDVRATPLAGSAPRFSDPAEDRASARRLFESTKEREEHALVSEHVAATLGHLCDELEYPKEPELIGTANVWHLATPFRGRPRPSVASVLDIVAALHPTPAVCGTPRDAARRALEDLEPVDRGCYAGPVGWVAANGDGEWAIALRCAEITGATARLFAGAGIVRDSVPELELDETERKFRALLDSLRWG
ncbi:MAG: isochorismate synthase [Actinomycetota bacterium]